MFRCWTCCFNLSKNFTFLPVDGTWNGYTAIKVNDRLSFLRYRGGEYYDSHVDVPYEDTEKQLESFLTLQIYLNSRFTGGETRFLQEVGFNKMEDRKYLDLVPQTGAALLFEHELNHAGMPVGYGVKYAMRTDIMGKK